jgi:hypothetical protein
LHGKIVCTVFLHKIKIVTRALLYCTTVDVCYQNQTKSLDAALSDSDFLSFLAKDITLQHQPTHSAKSHSSNEPHFPMKKKRIL